MNYTSEERETHICGNDAEKAWKIYTLQTTIMTKLKRAGIEPVKVDSDGAHYYELDWNQVSFRSGKREISEAQKEKLRERMKNMHRNKSKKI